MFFFYTVVTTTVGVLPLKDVECPKCQVEDALKMSFTNHHTEVLFFEGALPHRPQAVVYCDACRKKFGKWSWSQEIKDVYAAHRNEFRGKGFFRITKGFWIFLALLAALCVGLYLYEYTFQDVSGTDMKGTVNDAMTDIQPGMIFGLNIAGHSATYVTWIIVDEVNGDVVMARKYRTPLDNQTVNPYASKDARPKFDVDNFESTPFKLEWIKGHNLAVPKNAKDRSDLLPEEWGRGGLQIWEVVKP